MDVSTWQNGLSLAICHMYRALMPLDSPIHTGVSFEREAMEAMISAANPKS